MAPRIGHASILAGPGPAGARRIIQLNGDLYCFAEPKGWFQTSYHCKVAMSVENSRKTIQEIHWPLSSN